MEEKKRKKIITIIAIILVAIVISIFSYLAYQDITGKKRKDNTQLITVPDEFSSNKRTTQSDEKVQSLQFFEGLKDTVEIIDTTTPKANTTLINKNRKKVNHTAKQHDNDPDNVTLGVDFSTAPKTVVKKKSVPQKSEKKKENVVFNFAKTPIGASLENRYNKNNSTNKNQENIRYYEAIFYTEQTIENHVEVKILLLEDMNLENGKIYPQQSIFYGVAQLKGNRFIIPIYRTMFNYVQKKIDNDIMRIYDINYLDGIFVNANDEIKQEIDDGIIDNVGELGYGYNSVVTNLTRTGQNVTKKSNKKNNVSLKLKDGHKCFIAVREE